MGYLCSYHRSKKGSHERQPQTLLCHKRYCAILCHLKQLYPTELRGNQSRHLQTLAALISGVIGSKSCQLPAIASEVPGGASLRGGKRESRSKRFARFLQNKKVTPETFFVPYAQALVQSLPPGPLVLVMDGSVVGRGCMALMLSVLYQQGKLKRALPLCWLVTKAPKGHFTQERHQALLAQVKHLIPAHRKVVFLGDGEFDGCDLLAAICWQTSPRPDGTTFAAPPRMCFWPSAIGRRSAFRPSILA